MERRVLLDAEHGGSIRERDLAHGHSQVRAAAGHVYLAGVGEGPDGLFGQGIGAADEFFGDGAHVPASLQAREYRAVMQAAAKHSLAEVSGQVSGVGQVPRVCSQPSVSRAPPASARCTRAGQVYTRPLLTFLSDICKPRSVTPRLAKGGGSA